jgi:hypothetical protein
MKTTLNKLSTIAIGTVLSTAAFTTFSTTAQALTLTQWNFNSPTPDGNASTGTITPNIGSGTASLIGGTTATFASGDANGGSTDPITGSPTDDSGWNVTGFPAQGTANKTAGVQFLVSTVGQQNIVITFDQRHSNSVANAFQFQYTLDGSSYVDSTLFTANAGDTWFNNRTVNLSSITGANDNANFGFRIVSAFNPTAYVGTTTGTSYATTGTARFDMVTVSADPVPEPTTIATGLLAVGAGRMIQRKRQKAAKLAAK